MAEKDKVIQGYQAPAYQESDAVKNAQQQLQQQIANKPGDYQSQWQGQLDSLFQQIQNRKPFQYDINTDALYQQAAQQYIQQGQKAMMDTMGQAAALTGGYGNSYAQSVGQQTYQGYLQGLYEQMPQYAQLALDRYNQEGQDMLDLYAMMGQNEDRDYNRYMDMLSAYQAELNRLQGIYDSEREFDYGKYADDRDFGYSQYINDRDYAFQLEQAEEAKRQWQAEFDEAKRQYDQNYALSVSKSSGSSGGGGGGGPRIVKQPEEEQVGYTYNSVRDDVIAMKANGTSNSAIQETINQAYKEGIITDAQRMGLSMTYNRGR